MMSKKNKTKVREICVTDFSGEIHNKDWYFHCWFCFLIFVLKAALYVNPHVFLIYERSCLEINGKVPVFSEDSWILIVFIGYN